MRVVTFNVHWGTVGRGPRVDSEALARVCAGFEADLIGLQEVDRGMRRSGRVDLTARVAEAAGMEPVFAPTGRGGLGRWGNALLVRGEIADVEAFRLPRLERRTKRGAIIASVTPARHGSLPMAVAVAHLGVKADEQAVQLPHVLARLQRRPPPRVFLGDCNADVAAVRRHCLTTGIELVEEGGPTFPAEQPEERIDHVAVAGLAVRSVNAPATPISDHRPLVVDLGPR